MYICMQIYLRSYVHIYIYIYIMYMLRGWSHRHVAPCVQPAQFGIRAQDTTADCEAQDTGDINRLSQ